MSHSHGHSHADDNHSNNNTTLQSSNLTPPGHEDCSIQHFPTLLFASQHEHWFGDQHERAHFLLGISLGLIVLIWSSFAMDKLSISRSLFATSAVQLLMGLYLFVWCFYLLQPNDVINLIQYSLSDLRQLQHVAISLLLIASGAIEVLQAVRFLISRQWTMLWTACMVYVGLIFFAHPQHGYGHTVQHIMLGFTMVAGGLLFGRAKEAIVDELQKSSTKRSVSNGRYSAINQSVNQDNSDDPDDEDPVVAESRRLSLIDCNFIVSGVFFMSAACILVLYEDHSNHTVIDESINQPVHLGLSWRCQPSWPLTIGGFLLSIFTYFSLMLTGCLYSRRCAPLATRCCPAEEANNIWCCLLNTCLCVKAVEPPKSFKRSIKPNYPSRVMMHDDEDHGVANGMYNDQPVAGAASAAFAQLVRQKEAEEQRERDRAIARLKEMEGILGHFRVPAARRPAEATSSQTVNELTSVDDGSPDLDSADEQSSGQADDQSSDLHDANESENELEQIRIQ